MHIEIIDNLSTFEAIKANWDSVYSRDNHAHFFISWDWVSTTIQEISRREIPWMILAAKPETNADEYIGFLPLKIYTLKSEEDKGFYHELGILALTDAEHAGCLSLPEYDAEVISAFTSYLQKQDYWSNFSIDNLAEDNEKLELFSNSFDTPGFKIEKLGSEHYTNPLDNIDNQIVPYLPLPDSWELYLQNNISSNTRQKIRRFLRKVENSDELRITDANADNIEQHIEVLAQLWRTSWESRKGVKDCGDIIYQMRFELKQCFERGCLHLPILWQGEKPLATVANLVDFEKKTISFLIGGRDETFRKFPPGFVLHARAIREAIAQGFKTYDFLSGNEAYKYSFGAQERRVQSITIKRQNLTQQRRQINPRALPVLLRMSQYCHNTNDLERAEAGYLRL